jgi:hypothetical protein
MARVGLPTARWSVESGELRMVFAAITGDRASRDGAQSATLKKFEVLALEG